MSPEPAVYWPWWMGALALAGVTFGFWIATRRQLGISGFYARLLAWRASRGHDRLAADEAALEVALLEATPKLSAILFILYYITKPCNLNLLQKYDFSSLYPAPLSCKNR